MRSVISLSAPLRSPTPPPIHPLWVLQHAVLLNSPHPPPPCFTACSSVEFPPPPPPCFTACSSVESLPHPMFYSMHPSPRPQKSSQLLDHYWHLRGLQRGQTVYKKQRKKSEQKSAPPHLFPGLLQLFDKVLSILSIVGRETACRHPFICHPYPWSYNLFSQKLGWDKETPMWTYFYTYWQITSRAVTVEPPS